MSDDQLKFDFPKPQKAVTEKFPLPNQEQEKKEARHCTLDKLFEIARQDEARSKTEFVAPGIKNPDYDENYKPAEDEIGF